MASVDVVPAPGGAAFRQAPDRGRPATRAQETYPAAVERKSSAPAAPNAVDEAILASNGAPQVKRERFIPLTRNALIDRLARPEAWPDSMAKDVRRLFRYLSYWRQQDYASRLLEMEQTYEPFSPDTDLLLTRAFTGEEKAAMQRRLVGQVQKLLEQANFTRIEASQVEVILTRESEYGLDLQVDLSAFEEMLIYYRGSTNQTKSRRTLKKLYLKQVDYDVPIFQRLFVLFKLKPEEVRVREVMAEQKIDRKSAEKFVRKLRSSLPAQVKSDFIYLKLFKNIPRSDIEMCFPNTRVKFRMFDKVKLGVTAGGGLGVGAFGAAGKIALAASNPIAAAGALFGLGGIAIRQGMNFMNQRQRYMVTMAQNLYFHAMADNRGVMTLLADRASEEDVKEEILLYSALAKERVKAHELNDIDASIEQWLLNTFGLEVDFDLSDALDRLLADGIVVQDRAGWLQAVPPAEACQIIDRRWDRVLDDLPDIVDEGQEQDEIDEPENGDVEAADTAADPRRGA